MLCGVRIPVSLLAFTEPGFARPFDMELDGDGAAGHTGELPLLPDKLLNFLKVELTGLKAEEDEREEALSWETSTGKGGRDRKESE